MCDSSFPTACKASPSSYATLWATKLKTLTAAQNACITKCGAAASMTVVNKTPPTVSSSEAATLATCQAACFASPQSSATKDLVTCMDCSDHALVGATTAAELLANTKDCMCESAASYSAGKMKRIAIIVGVVLGVLFLLGCAGAVAFMVMKQNMGKGKGGGGGQAGGAASLGMMFG